jgi:hypothetical protein
LLGQVLATAETQLSDPPGFFFAAMPSECTPQKSASNDGEENNLAYLSFGSDTEYLAEMYVIVNSEVKQNGSLAMGSLLRPGIIEEVKSALDEQFVTHTVFFPVFTRYLLAPGQSSLKTY